MFHVEHYGHVLFLSGSVVSRGTIPELCRCAYPLLPPGSVGLAIGRVHVDRSDFRDMDLEATKDKVKQSS